MALALTVMVVPELRRRSGRGPHRGGRTRVAHEGLIGLAPVPSIAVSVASSVVSLSSKER